MRRLHVAPRLAPVMVFAMAVIVLLAIAGPARASDYLTEAAAALKHSRIFAPHVKSTITSQIQGQLDPGGNIAVVIVPASAANDGTAQDFATRLDNATGHRHVLVVQVGDKVVDASRLIPTSELSTELDHAQSNGTSPTETAITLMLYLQDWEKANPGLVRQPPPPPSTTEPGSSSSTSQSGHTSALLLVFMGVVAVIALSLTGYSIMVMRRRPQRNLAKGLPRGSDARKRIDVAQETIEQIEALTAQLKARGDQSQAVDDLTDGCIKARDLVRLVVKKAPLSIESKTSELYNRSLIYVLETLRQYLQLLRQPDYFGSRREVRTLTEQGQQAFAEMRRFALKRIVELNSDDVDAYRRAVEGLQSHDEPNFFQ